MKSIYKNLVLCVFASTLVITSCTKDKGKEAGELTLKSVLSGTYNVTSATYIGEIQSIITIDIEGDGKNTSGTYNFMSASGKVDYDFSTIIEQDILTQTVEFPVTFSGEGDFNITGDNAFTIDDPQYGLIEYDVTKKSKTGFTAVSSFDIDTAGSNVIVDVTMVFEK